MIPSLRLHSTSYQTYNIANQDILQYQIIDNYYLECHIEMFSHFNIHLLLNSSPRQYKSFFGRGCWYRHWSVYVSWHLPSSTSFLRTKFSPKQFFDQLRLLFTTDKNWPDRCAVRRRPASILFEGYGCAILPPYKIQRLVLRDSVSIEMFARTCAFFLRNSEWISLEGYGRGVCQFSSGWYPVWYN